ncbi:uncharacterized protein LOC128552218, partial [Mercenaria mercenaria]|uniref:uncharacterized protein LOC128552218 n=1 Tax=Mercenaria mercenaria TaxID=6596 RepID=UPI00234F2EE0
LQNKQTDICISQDFQKQIEEIKEHAKGELAEKIEEAKNQYYMKVQQLEQQLKMTEKDLQLKRDLRSTPAKSKPKAMKLTSLYPFELELHLQVTEPTGETSTEGNQRIYQTMEKYVKGIKTPINSTDESVHRLLGYISKLKDCKIVDDLKIEKSAYIKIHCFTTEAIKEFLKLINRNEFQEEVVVLQKCLDREKNINVHDVTVSCSSESIGNTRKRLYDRCPPRGFTCSNHKDTQCTWYCSDHDVFCCSKCKDLGHRSCVGLKQVVSERSHGKQNQSLAIKGMIGKYNVQIKNRFMKRDDNDGDDCKISSICMHPDGNVLLVDTINGKLKKLGSSYNVVSQCDILKVSYWTDVCYIGDDRAVVCYENGKIQYVNVSDKLKLEHYIKLDHGCKGLACNSDKLYVRDDNTIYTYTIRCEQKHLLYSIKGINPCFSRIAISDNGELIYITIGAKGLITIDNKGNHLFTLKPDICNVTVDVCVVGDGTVLVLDENASVHQVDYSGKQVLGTVIVQSDNVDTQYPFCFDRQRCRLIVAGSRDNCIHVFKLQHHNSDTFMK